MSKKKNTTKSYAKMKPYEIKMGVLYHSLTLMLDFLQPSIIDDPRPAHLETSPAFKAKFGPLISDPPLLSCQHDIAKRTLGLQLTQSLEPGSSTPSDVVSAASADAHRAHSALFNAVSRDESLRVTEQRLSVEANKRGNKKIAQKSIARQAQLARNTVRSGEHDHKRRQLRAPKQETYECNLYKTLNTADLATNLHAHVAPLERFTMGYFSETLLKDADTIDRRLEDLLTKLRTQLTAIEDRYQAAKGRDDTDETAYITATNAARNAVISAMSRCVVAAYLIKLFQKIGTPKQLDVIFQTNQDPGLLYTFIATQVVVGSLTIVRTQTPITALLPSGMARDYFTTPVPDASGAAAACGGASAAMGGGASAAAAAAAGPGLFLQPASPREQLDGELLSECIKLLKTLGEAAEKPTGEDGQGKSYRDRANSAIAKRSNTALNAVIEMMRSQLSAKPPTASY